MFHKLSLWLPYFVLAIAMSVGMWAMTNRTDNKIRHDINTYATQQCLTSSVETIKTYNKFIDTLIQQQQVALEDNLLRGDLTRAANNKKAIKQFTASKLQVPTVEQCEKPILNP